MIIQCQSCAARYFLPEERVPANPLKVRCPKCRAVFMLAPRPAELTAVAVTATATEAAPAPAPPAQKPIARPVELDTVASKAAPVPPTPGAPQAEKAKPSRAGGSKSPDDRARRLARVLVSDILCYNRERRDQALHDGTLMATLSEEIKKSWELYKEKVGPETAHSTNHFKEALNEILANGQEIF